MRGGSEWDIDLGNGQHSAVIACGVHPLDFPDLPELTTDTGKAKLSFGAAPDHVRVDCWPDSQKGKSAAHFHAKAGGVEKNELTLGWELSLEEGGWIYNVTAVWENYGTADYAFYIVKN